MSPTVVQELEVPELHPRAIDEGARLGERLDLIDDVSVRIEVVLGAAEIRIGELFSMAPGAVMTLDREVDAPVDLRVRGKLVARGVLVAAGDQFGVRITELLTS